ncbi:MAG: rhodanese-like domain-containing protein [Candidatus Thiodiazotropha sp.]
MRKSLIYAVAMTGLLNAWTLQAAPEPQDPKKQTPWHLYVDAREAYEMKQAQGAEVLFVDVRDPIEIMFTGFTDVVDINIPYKLANRSEWNPKKPVYQMTVNADFEQQVNSALQARGLSKSAPIILMCRSGGTRGAPSAKMLWDKGYEQVYVVTDGFEGGKVKQGEHKGWRLLNGWKNANLPWSYKLNREKMYFPADGS